MPTKPLLNNNFERKILLFTVSEIQSINFTFQSSTFKLWWNSNFQHLILKHQFEFLSRNLFTKIWLMKLNLQFFLDNFFSKNSNDINSHLSITFSDIESLNIYQKLISSIFIKNSDFRRLFSVYLRFIIFPVEISFITFDFSKFIRKTSHLVSDI